MKYNLSDKQELEQAFDYLTLLAGRESMVEIKRVVRGRTIQQNKYLHVLLGGFGAHFGYTLAEAKLIYKQLNENIYKYTKDVRGKTHTFYRSSADLDTAEMTKTIDTLREWSDKAGYYLPAANEEEYLRQLENEIERATFYL